MNIIWVHVFLKLNHGGLIMKIDLSYKDNVVQFD